MNKLKRKYGDRVDWIRVIKREFVQAYLDQDCIWKRKMSIRRIRGV